MTILEKMKQSITTELSSAMIDGKLLSQQGYSVALFRSIHDVPAKVWSEAAPPDNIFLQQNYLSVVEDHPPVGMKFCYFLFFKDKQAVGVALGQIQYFRAGESIPANEKTGSKNGPCFFTTFARFLRDLVTKKVEFNVLINGNTLLTGEHGCYFNPEVVAPKLSVKLLHEALDFALEANEKHGEKLSGTLIKDFYEKSHPHCTTLTELGHNEFTVQPSMLMDIRPEWNSFDDYMEALQSKYRVRVRRALKKAKPITKKEFDAQDIEHDLPQLFQLYKNIAANSGFNMVNLNETYLLGLKKQFPEDFRMIGYYLKGELVGFYTTIRNHDELEAHFLGLDPEHNHNYQLYLNMLYDMVRQGIEKKVHRIVFARTAMAIKSSVGAVAHEMYCYMRHRNSFPNKFVRPILSYLRPEQDWEPRHPFK